MHAHPTFHSLLTKFDALNPRRNPPSQLLANSNLPRRELHPNELFVSVACSFHVRWDSA